MKKVKRFTGIKLSENHYRSKNKQSRSFHKLQFYRLLYNCNRIIRFLGTPFRCYRNLNYGKENVSSLLSFSRKLRNLIRDTLRPLLNLVQVERDKKCNFKITPFTPCVTTGKKKLFRRSPSVSSIESTYEGSASDLSEFKDGSYESHEGSYDD